MFFISFFSPLKELSKYFVYTRIYIINITKRICNASYPDLKPSLLSNSLPRRRSFGSSRNLSFVGEERLRDEPKERLQGRLA